MLRHLRIPVVVIALAFAVASATVPAYALAPKDAVSECDLNGLLKQLAKIKPDESTTSIQAELDLRKQILVRSMSCNAHEASVLSSSVDALDGKAAISSILKRRYAVELNEAATYATNQGNAAAALTSVTSTKELAAALKGWRTDTYNPLVWEASQLIVLDRNIVLASSGEARLEQLEKNLTDLGDVDGTAGVKDDLSQAATLITDAEKKLNDALVLLKSSPNDSQEEIVNNQKTGLNDLSLAYRLLLDGNAKLNAIPAPKK